MKGAIVLLLFITVTSAAGCKRGNDPAAAPVPSGPAEATGPKSADEKGGARQPASDTPAEKPAKKVLPPTTIRLATADRTSVTERPVDLSAELAQIAAGAAKATGFTVGEEGHKAEVEVHYGLSVDGRPDPKAEKGLLAYSAVARLRLVDEMGLGEIIEGHGRGEAPFVRGTIPDLHAGFRQLVGEAIESALRDVAVQIRFRSLPAKDALEGLASEYPEVRGASARRLADLGEKTAVPRLIALFADAELLETAVLAAALGQLGDGQAVRPLLARVEGVPTDIGIIIVDALAAIGTPEARDGIRRIGETHPLEEVRDAARELMGTRN